MAKYELDYQPTSGLGWVDFSEEDRNKVMKVIEMMQPSGTVDELGIGVIRDAFSDAMFMGITTIMTRAKYYFITPRILTSYITNKKIQKKTGIREYLREQETEIMMELARNYKFDEKQRIIGISVAKHNDDLPRYRWKELVRKPSSIYWNAIRQYDIYTGKLPLSVFLNTYNSTDYLNETGFVPTGDDPGDSRDAYFKAKVPFKLPDYDKKWRENLSIELTYEEADFLKNKIIDSHPELLLAKILSKKKYTKEFLDAKTYDEMLKMPFMNLEGFEDVRHVAYTAHYFWKILFGAHIRYNIVLHQRHGLESEEKKNTDLWTKWFGEMQLFDWNSFDKDYMWQLAKSRSTVKGFTEKFVNKWIELIQSGNADTKTLDLLVEKQEYNNKVGRAKLRKENDERYDSWIGIRNMDFRFGNAKIIVDDIFKGMYYA